MHSLNYSAGKAFTSFSFLSQLFCVGATHKYALRADFCILLQVLRLGYRNLDLVSVYDASKQGLIQELFTVL